MIKNIVLAVAAAIVGVLAVAAFRPATYHFERSIHIEAPPETVYPLVSDFRRYVEWSPWELRDPQMKRGFSGAASGVGAVYAWSGNSNAGQGRMEIVEAHPPTDVRIRLNVLRPVNTDNTSRFELKPDGQGTLVTWSLEGPNPYLARLVQVFVGLDRLVGGDFDAGLARLKVASEKS